MKDKSYIKQMSKNKKLNNMWIKWHDAVHKRLAVQEKQEKKLNLIQKNMKKELDKNFKIEELLKSKALDFQIKKYKQSGYSHQHVEKLIKNKQRWDKK